MFLADLFEDDADLIATITKQISATGKRLSLKESALPLRSFPGTDHRGSFAKYIRSTASLSEILAERFGSPSLILDNCIRLYTEYNYKIVDSITVEFPVDQIYKYREYDRKVVNNFTGKMTGEEYAELRSDIEQNGIMNYGVLNIYSKGRADYGVVLGEGNHRLRIAMELGIPVMPLKFYYGIAN